jgi:hypothetical protein
MTHGQAFVEPLRVRVGRHNALSCAFICGALTAGVGVSACARGPVSSLAHGYDAQVIDGLTRLRAATEPFHSLDAAVAVGYPRTVADCLVHEHHGAMGYHHLNRDYLDTKLAIERPQILLYQRMADSSYRLNGVEFIVPYRLWPRDSVAPALMGRKLSHEDNLKIWYLHVWAWTRNPEGLFANFNPDVACLPGTGKVYTPYAEPSP